MDHASTIEGITEGTDVYGSDGHKVGSIVEVRANYVVVEKGFLFPTDYYIPVSAFAGVQGTKLTLNVTKDAALNQGWDARPNDFDPTTAGGRVRDDSANDVLVDASGGGAIADAATSVGDPVAPTGTEPRVRVARHEVGQQVGPAETVEEEDLLDFPVYGDEVQTQKRVHVAEEVEVTKEPVQRTAEATGTVRHEEVHVVGHVVEIDERKVADIEGGPRADRW